MSRNYKVVIFDWDGTLADSQAQIISCMQSAFRQLDFQPPTATSIRHIVGLSLGKAISLLDPKLDFETIDRLAETYRSIAFTNKEYVSELFLGTRNCLDHLRQQHLNLAVATGKSRRGLDAALGESGLDHYFDITRCADETRSKPHPLMLEEILTDLNLEADQAVMVGDTTYDIDMASNIGMDSIAVTYGMHDETVLVDSEPSYLIHDLTELLPLIYTN